MSLLRGKFIIFGKHAVRRADFLGRIATEIDGICDALLERAHLETCLLRERMRCERGRASGQLRLVRSPVTLQDFTEKLLPPELRNANPFGSCASSTTD
jgi:hypothetical protein